MKKKVLAALMAAVTVCGSFSSVAFADDDATYVHDATYEGTANSATVKHESISIAMDTEPGNLSPEEAVDSGGSMWKYSVYERLFEINGIGGGLVGSVASSYEQIDDTTYRVYLYEGVYDSDGNELHASDVIYSYDTLLAAGNRMSGDIAKYDHGEVVDDYTVDLIMNAPLDGLSDLSAILAQPYVYCEQAAIDHNLATDPCGTGPYYVSDYQSGASITLEAKDDYWAEGTDHQTIRQCANVQTIYYKVVAEASQNSVGLQTGELDFSSYVSATDIAQFQEGGAYSDNYTIDQYLDNLTIALFANCDENSSICADENLRAAIFYALDGEQLALASGSNGYVVSSTLGNMKFIDYNSDWETEENYYHEQNLELAMEYLAQSSYDGSTLTIILNNESMLENVATAIVAILQNIGINCAIESESDTITDSKQVAGEYDLIITKMASDDYLPIVWQRWYSEAFHSVTYTICNSDDQTIQDLLNACIVVGGDTEENVNAFHEYIIEHYYGYGLFSQLTSNVVTNDIETACWTFQDYLIPGGCIYVDNEF
ncbi:MAG: ABC transporter substrate-binding protein [Lachnospiraceae bacterium]|nr:ABC transporter substrate-binding protein [Lachnospiraceae bacterium]